MAIELPGREVGRKLVRTFGALLLSCDYSRVDDPRRAAAERCRALRCRVEEQFQQIVDFWTLTMEGAAPRLTSFPEVTLKGLQKMSREVDRTSREELNNLEEATSAALRDLQMIASGLVLAGSAVLVFAHSIVDDIASQACQLIAEADPQAWDLDSKTVPLGDLKTKTREEVRRDVLNKHLESLERESLEKRVSAVLSKCPDQPRQLILDGQLYKFDMGELLRLDQLRQNIIHRVVIDKPISSQWLKQMLVFYGNTCLFLLDTVAARFGLDRT